MHDAICKKVVDIDQWFYHVSFLGKTSVPTSISYFSTYYTSALNIPYLEKQNYLKTNHFNFIFMSKQLNEISENFNEISETIHTNNK